MDPHDYLEILDSDDDDNESKEQESNEQDADKRIQRLTKESNEKISARIKDSTTLTTTIEPVQPGQQNAEQQHEQNPSVSGSSSFVPTENPLFLNQGSDLGSGADQGQGKNQGSEQVQGNQNNKNPRINCQRVKRSTESENPIQEPEEESTNNLEPRTERIWSSFSRFLGCDLVESEIYDENSRSINSRFSISSSSSSSSSSSPSSPCVIELELGSSNESEMLEFLESSTSSVVVPIGTTESLNSVKKVLNIPKSVPKVALKIGKLKSSLTEKLTQPAVSSACAITNSPKSMDELNESEQKNNPEKLASVSTTDDAQPKDLEEASKEAPKDQVLDSNSNDTEPKESETKNESNPTAQSQQVEDSKSLPTSSSSSSTSSTTSLSGLEAYPDPSITLLSRALFTASSAKIKYQNEFVCVSVTKLLAQQPPTGESVFTVSTIPNFSSGSNSLSSGIQVTNEKLHQSFNSMESFESESAILPQPKSILHKNRVKKVRGRPRKNVSFSLVKVPSTKPRPRLAPIEQETFDSTCCNNNPLDLSPSSAYFLSHNPIGTNFTKNAHAQSTKLTRSTSGLAKRELKLQKQNSGQPKDLSNSKKNRKRASPESKDLEQSLSKIKKRYNLRN